MRCFSLCASFFVIVIILVQFSFAQNTQNVDYHVLYDQINYTDYQYGIVVDGTGSIPGVLLRNVNGIGIPVPGQKLTIVGGGDFIFPVETDENGEFLFDPAEVGSYSVILDNGDIISSLDFKVTAYQPTAVSLQADTGVTSSRIILVIEENSYLRFAATDGSAALVAPVAPLAPAAPLGGATSAGMMAGSAGNFGMLAGALGAAGLATGIAAIATTNNNDTEPKPVSVGARSRSL